MMKINRSIAIGGALGIVAVVSAISSNLSAIVLFTWIWIFFLGLATKVLIQSFSSPFMNKSDQEPVPKDQIETLNNIRAISLMLGVFFLIGEILFTGTPSVLSSTLIIYGAAVHIGAHWLNIRGWYFNR